MQYVRVMSCIVYPGVMCSMLESCHVLLFRGHVQYVRVMSCILCQCRGHVQYVRVMSCIDCLFRGHVQYVIVMSCIVYSGVMFSMLESCH